ncbi:MAG: acetate--CoA ligase family protein, partial [Pseudomonadota bacterium]
TGALLAEDDVTDAFLREIGIARVTCLDALVEAPMLFRGRKPLDGDAPRIGVVTTTGGGGATVCDRLALEGVEIHAPSKRALEVIRATGLSISAGPMVDLTMAGAGPEFVRPAIEAVAAQEGVDLVLSVSGSSGRSSPERTVPPLVEADTCGKPLACFIVPDALESLNGMIAGGHPVFRSPEACADAIGAFCRWRVPRISALARLPKDTVPRVLNEGASLRMLEAAGIPVPQTVRCWPGDRPDLPFQYPVVAKVLSDEVPHKTDAGGVILNIQNAEELSQATLRIKFSVERHYPGVVVDQILIAPLVDCLQEVLIGYRLDPSVGPIVTLAPGGILVGLYDDKAIRCAPIDRATAHEMIGEVKGLAPIRGHRGLPKGDLNALADAVTALSQFASHQPTVLEAEANPVMVLPTGVVAVDALVTLAGEDKI